MQKTFKLFVFAAVSTACFAGCAHNAYANGITVEPVFKEKWDTNDGNGGGCSYTAGAAPCIPDSQDPQQRISTTHQDPDGRGGGQDGRDGGGRR